MILDLPYNNHAKKTCTDQQVAPIEINEKTHTTYLQSTNNHGAGTGLRHQCTSIVSYFNIWYYAVRYFTGIFYAVVRQISMLFIDNKDSGFCVRETNRA